MQLVRSMADRGLDLFFLIGDERPLHNLTFILRQKRAEHRPAGVHPFAARAFVADGDDGGCIFHIDSSLWNVPWTPPVLESRRTSVMTMSRWTALHMS